MAKSEPRATAGLGRAESLLQGGPGAAPDLYGSTRGKKRNAAMGAHRLSRAPQLVLFTQLTAFVAAPQPRCHHITRTIAAAVENAKAQLTK